MERQELSSGSPCTHPNIILLIHQEQLSVVRLYRHTEPTVRNLHSFSLQHTGVGAVCRFHIEVCLVITVVQANDRLMSVQFADKCVICGS